MVNHEPMLCFSNMWFLLTSEWHNETHNVQLTNPMRLEDLPSHWPTIWLLLFNHRPYIQINHLGDLSDFDLISPKLDEEQLRWWRRLVSIMINDGNMNPLSDSWWLATIVAMFTHGSRTKKGYQYFRWSKANGGFLGKGYRMSRINSYLVSFFPSACWSGGLSCLAIWQNAEEKDL